jgi:hypothetical protein
MMLDGEMFLFISAVTIKQLFAVHLQEINVYEKGNEGKKWRKT